MITCRTSLLVALGLATSTSVGVGQTPQRIRVDRIAAVVGEVAIPESRVEEQLLRMRRQEGFPTDSSAVQALRMRVLEQLVENELLMQVADQDTAVSVSEETIQQAAETRLRELRTQFATNAEYERELRRSGLTSAEEHRRLVTEELRIQMTRDALLGYLRASGQLRSIPPTESEMRAFFEEQVAEGGLGPRPPTVTFRQIVVRPEADSTAIRAAFLRADSALRRVRGGEDFAAVAREMTEDPGSRDNGGSLGWVRRGLLDRDFEEVAFRLRPGQISPIVPTQFGFHVIQVQRIDAAEIMVRHILSTPVVTDENRATGRAVADSIVLALRAGGAFDSLVALHHDSEEESLLDRVVQERLPAVYATALAGAQPGDVMGPVALSVPTGEKYAVLIFEEVTGEGEFTFDELRDRIRIALADQNGLQRYLNELKAGTYIDLRLGRPTTDRLVPPNGSRSRP